MSKTMGLLDLEELYDTLAYEAKQGDILLTLSQSEITRMMADLKLMHRVWKDDCIEIEDQLMMHQPHHYKLLSYAVDILMILDELDMKGVQQVQSVQDFECDYHKFCDEIILKVKRL
ncbi:MAG: hypothetical protein AAFV93_00210 [Chloroflexota bacterium]